MAVTNLLSDEQINTINAARWAEVKAVGEREGFGFMIQVAATEWAQGPYMGYGGMAEWLRRLAKSFEPPT